ncbi:hypothetical protein [Clostridium tetani]|uniref:hypothetical protein n=1 Tax=Clostridium tetani TaxID=1513 RepID=UPI002953CD8A|nr:hypothetical protein [Clostridium tetani]
MKIEKIIKTQQPNIHKRLRQQNRKKKSRKGKEHLSFFDVVEPMKHDSYYRGKGGALKQK